MRPLKEPSRRLAELVYLQLERRAPSCIDNTTQIDTFVGEGMEHVVILNRSLFKTKNQIDPQMDALTDIIALQGFPMSFDKICGRGAPRRQSNVVQSSSGLRASQGYISIIFEEGAVSLKKLRY